LRAALYFPLIGQDLMASISTGGVVADFHLAVHDFLVATIKLWVPNLSRDTTTMQRITEPEVMDSVQEAIEYDAMDFLKVNTAFAESAIALCPSSALILDAGTGTARIPIIICQHRPHWQIIGIDLAQSMLDVGKKNVEQAGLQQQIKLELVDAKQMPYPDAHFDMVVSNSIIHHLPTPLPFLQEIKRVLKPNGAIFIRDLLRPKTSEIVEILVNHYAADCNEHQKMLFRDSLHAAFTLDEINELMHQAGLERIHTYQSSDRHWTAERIGMLSKE
jgi:ubiquinone/menaquinone biosynthesis C-methylase UbiE